MSTPRVTILMSVYNSAPFLERAVRSMLTQTFTDFEFVIINDGSRDESPRILEGLQEPRMRVIHSENRGLAAALERGVREARAPYIARMDSDDVALPERLAAQVEFLDRNPAIGLVDADHQQIDNQDRSIPTVNDRSLAHPGMISWKLVWQNVVCHPLVMVRREVLTALGQSYDPTSVTEDYDLWTRLLFKTGFGHIPKVLLHYRRNPGGMTGTRTRSQLESMTRIHARTLELLLDRPVDPSVGRALAILSQQVAIQPSAEDLAVDSMQLVALAIEAKRKFAAKTGASPADLQHVEADLAQRFLDWGFLFSQVPGRSRESTGCLMRRAVSLRPRVALDRRLWRNLLARALGTANYLRWRSSGAPPSPR